jgi:hypothetical protein
MVASILNYTTTIAAEKTLGEVQGLLSRNGASRVSVHYDPDGVPVGLEFHIKTAQDERDYQLPLDLEAVLRLLDRASRERDPAGRRPLPASWVTREHAARVGWRVIKDWVEAQLALVAIGLASLDEVMMPYQIVDGGPIGHVRLYQAWQAHQQLPKPAEGPE